MKDVLSDIEQYSEHMTISNVITYFSRKGIIITKSMIQNHVRDGLLPPPVNKRHYTHKHITSLALITVLKNVYEMTVIKSVLAPLTDSEGIPIHIYRTFINKMQLYLPQAVKTEADTLTLMLCSSEIKNEVISRLK